MNFEKRLSMEENELTLNLTPLMDIMFLLVIFFAVSTTFKVFPGISVNLPGAESERIKEEEKSVTAILTEAGEIFIDGKPIEKSHLVDTLRVRQKESPVNMFILEADTRAQHGQVVALMDAAKKAGILHLAISTRYENDSDRLP